MNNQSIYYGRKRSGIRRQLKKKIEDWLESIDDDDVYKAAKKDVIVTGGSIASMLLGEKINDYDVYFKTIETTEKIAKYYVNKFNKNNSIKVEEGVTPYSPHVERKEIRNIKDEVEDRVVIYIKSAGVAAEDQGTYNYFESASDDEQQDFVESTINGAAEEGEKYRPVFMSQNAITLSHKMQLVTRFYGDPEKIHDNYDFVHAMCYYDYKEDHLELNAEAMEALLSRTLIYRGSLYPIASIFRMKKFIERGWRITAGQQLKIMWQISEIDLKDMEILREQLTGVDMAYMWELISAVADVEPEKINSTYIATIIDRIFD